MEKDFIYEPEFENFDPEELENYGNNYFSSFEGEELDNYTGEGDDLLDFGGQGRSFASEADAQRIFVINITSTHTTTKTVRLFAGHTYWSLERGVVSDKVYVLKDGVFGEDQQDPQKKFTASGSPKPIIELQSFISNNPTNLAGMRISSNVVAQMQQQMIYRELSPFKDLQSRIIDLGAYTNENTYRDNMVTVPTPDIILSQDMLLDIPILPNSTVNITLFCGGVLSNSVGLKNKLERAAKTINRFGIQNIRRFEKVSPKNFNKLPKRYIAAPRRFESSRPFGKS